MSLFGTSGIRGVTNQEITPQFCLEIARAIGDSLPIGSRVCLATDTRISRDLIKAAVVSGLLSSGINVTDLGILPTPALALLTRESKFDTGIMITASHNPPEFNGIKLFNPNSLGYSRSQEQEIEDRYAGKGFRTVAWEDCGALAVNLEAGDKYVQLIEQKVSTWKIEPRFKLVIDPGNGASCGFASTLFKRMGFEVASINDEPDGLFPGRGPEPTEDSLRATVGFLRQQEADLAICFDGDADRVVFCDREGFLGYNEMASFIASLALRGNQNRKVITTVETGRLLELAVANTKAEVVRGKVGDVNVAYLAWELDAAIGVEQVGIYIFPEMGYYPDSFFAALFLLSQITDVGQIRDFYRQLPQLFFEKAKLPCLDRLKAAVMQSIVEGAAQNWGADRVSSLDGLRLEFEDSWLLIRASGTEPVIRVIAEATSGDRTKELVNRGIQLVAGTVEVLA